MKVLAISAHPDDETLGCGGMLLRHAAEGDSLFWLVVTEAYEPQWSAETIQVKATEVKRVAEAYGVQQYFKLGFPTIRLDTLPLADLIGRIRDIIQEVKPEVVYLLHGGDVNSDHCVVFTATMSVLKTFYMRKLGVRCVLSYETLSSTEAAPPLPHRMFIPNVYRDITPYIEQKVEIMGLYDSETHSDPWPRGPSAIRALARYRGASIGVDYAEAFMLIREVD
ncbi:PIG-L deacetylase family protein [Moorena producens]|uniref:PIG-L deacetylase family protein n=1 Tax=Moorena producens TaxID=1155739 RepID=UPI003C73C40B